MTWIVKEIDFFYLSSHLDSYFFYPKNIRDFLIQKKFNIFSITLTHKT